tara:strand:- start:744 stop:1196 length:453 start_codon:yes stop_codon:yes gene_type:complete
MKFNFKKGWVLRDFVVAGIFLTGVIALFALFIAGISSEYDQPELVSASFSENYNKLENITDRVDVMRSSIASGEGLSLIGSFDIAFTATFTVIQLVFSTLALVATMPIKVISDFTFIDQKVLTTFFIIVLSIITTILVFVWISSISRSKV